MQSTFSGIEMGKRGLIAHNQGLAVTGHNLTNASVDGYSRQRIEMKAVDPLYAPALNREETEGQIGQGVGITSITRIRDEILERRIVAGASGEGYWDNQDKYLTMIGQVYNEPDESSVRGLLDRFWEGWQELSVHPEESAARQAVVERGRSLMDGIHGRYNSLRGIRDMLEDELTAVVNRVNVLTGDITALNVEIVKVKAMGDNPNDLLDRRDLLVGELSSLIDVTTDGRDPDEFTVHTAGYALVQGRTRNELSLAIDSINDGYSGVFWKETGERATFAGGKLASILDLRDGLVRDEIQNIDLFTVNLVDMVNELHSGGYGLNGKTGLDFFSEYPFVTNVSGNYDRSGDGTYDSTYIFRMTGSNSLKPQDQIGLAGRITLSGPEGNLEIEYFPADTVADLIDRINNSGSEITARLDREGRLTLKGTPAADTVNPDFVIRHVEDSGQFLAGYAGLLAETGPGGSYDWARADAALALRGTAPYAVAPLAHPSGWIDLNPEILHDPSSVAAGFTVDGKSGEPGKGDAALAIASLRNSDVMIGRATSFDNYFADTVARIGLLSQEAGQSLETQNQIMKQLRDMQQSVAGVNIDEELAQMIKFQHGYAAAARFITTINDMLDTVINRMGV